MRVSARPLSMRVCFDSFCFASLGEDEEASDAREQPEKAVITQGQDSMFTLVTYPTHVSLVSLVEQL